MPLQIMSQPERRPNPIGNALGAGFLQGVTEYQEEQKREKERGLQTKAEIAKENRQLKNAKDLMEAKFKEQGKQAEAKARMDEKVRQTKLTQEFGVDLIQDVMGRLQKGEQPTDEQIAQAIKVSTLLLDENGKTLVTEQINKAVTALKTPLSYSQRAAQYKKWLNDPEYQAKSTAIFSNMARLMQLDPITRKAPISKIEALNMFHARYPEESKFANPGVWNEMRQMAFNALGYGGDLERQPPPEDSGVLGKGIGAVGSAPKDTSSEYDKYIDLKRTTR